MFESLTTKFSDTFRKLGGRGRISEQNVRDAMREVRTSLLEADVHYDVVRKFCDDVVDKALGAEVIQSLHPGRVRAVPPGADPRRGDHLRDPVVS